MNNKTKKITLSLIVATMIALVVSTPVYAGTTDTFVVTVRGSYLDIYINKSDWSINADAAIAMSSIYYSNQTIGAETDPHFTAVMLNGSVAVDLKFHVSSDGADWTAGDAPGANTYTLNATADLWASGASINLTDTAQTLKAGISASTNQTFDLMFFAPTSTTSGDLQTLTITATVAAT